MMVEALFFNRGTVPCQKIAGVGWLHKWGKGGNFVGEFFFGVFPLTRCK